jgi:hypothetical protein
LTGGNIGNCCHGYDHEREGQVAVHRLFLLTIAALMSAAEL